MAWHHLAFAVIPVWVFASVALHKPVLRIAEDNDDRWWGGYPLALAVFLSCVGASCAGSVCIGFYAATGTSPFS